MPCIILISMLGMWTKIFHFEVLFKYFFKFWPLLSNDSMLLILLLLIQLAKNALPPKIPQLTENITLLTQILWYATCFIIHISVFFIQNLTLCCSVCIFYPLYLKQRLIFTGVQVRQDGIDPDNMTYEVSFSKPHHKGTPHLKVFLMP